MLAESGGTGHNTKRPGDTSQRGCSAQLHLYTESWATQVIQGQTQDRGSGFEGTTSSLGWLCQSTRLREAEVQEMWSGRWPVGMFKRPRMSLRGSEHESNRRSWGLESVRSELKRTGLDTGDEPAGCTLTHTCTPETPSKMEKTLWRCSNFHLPPKRTKVLRATSWLCFGKCLTGERELDNRLQCLCGSSES